MKIAALSFAALHNARFNRKLRKHEPAVAGRCRAVALLCLALLHNRPTAAQKAEADPRAPSTRAMAARLEAIYKGTDWRTEPHKQPERIAYYRQMLATGKLSATDSLQVLLQLATEQLNAGASEEALASIATLRRLVEAKHIELPREFDLRVRNLAALASLRLGEQENCVTMHGQHSCIFPLQADGVHHLPRGAQGAIKELTALLALDPQDWESMWLLNLAYMQLGQYPAGVPQRWLAPEILFRSDADLGRFTDVAASAGLALTSHAGGAVMDDFDGDGLLDLAVSSSGPLDQMHLFHNNGDGTFSDRTQQAGLLGETGGLNLISTDFDNDGHLDLLVLRGAWWGTQGEYPVSLLRNRGDGTFEDVTEKAGLLTAAPAQPGAPTQTAAWADYDGDGWLDLFLGHETEPGPDGKPMHPSQLFHNNRDGTFTEVGASMGLANLGFVKGVAWGDFNNDGRPDLYVSVKGGRNHLFRNDGPGTPWRFTDVTAQAGVAQQTNSFATWFFDFDNDGWPDLFVAGYSTQSMKDVGAFELGKPFQAETPRLYRNNHDGTFTDVATKTGLNRSILPMGANFGDLDNDGWLDIYLGTGETSYQALLPNRMFHNRDGHAFEDITTSGGFGHLQKGHGVAFGDLANTGHEDIFEEMGGAFPGDTYTSVLYRNPGNRNHSITLELEGVKANRAAIGARLDLTFRDRGVVRHVYRTVGFGSSFGGNPLRQHIGLGLATSVDSVEIRWPGSGTVQVFAHLAADRMLHLRESDSTIREIALPHFQLSTNARPMAMDGMNR